jgi:hypothetical protein
MPQVMGQAPRIMPIVSQLITSAVPQHMRMHWERHLRGSAGPLDHPQEPSGGDWRPSFGDEHIRTAPLQRSQRPKLRPMQRMDALLSALCPVHMQQAWAKSAGALRTVGQGDEEKADAEAPTSRRESLLMPRYANAG